MAIRDHPLHQADVPPDYSTDYIGNRLIVVGVFFFVLEVFVLMLRFISRRLQKVSFAVDDGLILGSAICQFAMIGCCIADVYAGGVGQHMLAVATEHPEKMILWGKFVLVIPLLYMPAVTFPKLASLALFYTIFNDKRYRRACWWVAGLIVANWIGCMIPGFVVCRPLEYLWNPEIPGGGTCFDINAWYRWGTVVNIITDIVMIALPIPMTLGIQASRRVKIGLGLTFLTGSSGTITAIARFVSFFQEDFSNDGTWIAVKLLILSISEAGCYHIAACLMCMRPLLRCIWKKTPTAAVGPATSDVGTILKVPEVSLTVLRQSHSRGLVSSEKESLV